MASNIIRLNVPKEFPVLIENLAREVIRENPKNIITFAADYFENLLKEREKLLLKQEAAAVTIQKVYRRYSIRRQSILLEKDKHTSNTLQEKHEKTFQSEKFNHESAAVKIQRYYRGYAKRKSSRLLPKQSYTVSTATQRDYDTPQYTNAAVTIQTSYRNYRARKSLNEHKTTMVTITNNAGVENTLSEEVVLDVNVSTTTIQLNSSDDIEQAAIIIQRSYRKYTTRKKVEIIGEESQERIDD